MNTSMVKIDFELDPDEWHGESHEALWAERVPGDRDTIFTLKNSPFYIKGVSFMDIVEAHPTSRAGRFRFRHVIQKGGHSTYWLLVDKTNADFPDWWSQLQDLGCTYESTHFGDQKLLYSVDVPDTSNIDDVYNLVVHGKVNSIWLAAQPDVGRKTSEDEMPPR